MRHRLIAAIALTLVPTAALAHPGLGDAHGFVQGFAHPLGGLDHVLAMVTVGIFAWRSWQKAGHIEERAELTQQGLLAERGLTAAVLAHEIRNPLQALRFQIHSLRKNNADPTRVTATSGATRS